MSAESHVAQVAETFVELSDSLVKDFDITDLLHRLVNRVSFLLDIDAAGLLINDQRGRLELLASSTEATRLLELFQLQSKEGPCLDCFHTGKPVSVPYLSEARHRWPIFVPAAQQRGFASVHAIPMRLRSDVIGALNLFSATTGELPAEDLLVAQALADVATIAILQERAAEDNARVGGLIQAALADRMIIEQAKGFLSASGTDMNDSFAAMRRYARRTGSSLADVAEALVAGHIDPAIFFAPNECESRVP